MASTPKESSRSDLGFDRESRIELIKRSLGIKHKLKVFDSMKPGDTHEELSQTLVARWELEDELTAIEETLHDLRRQNVLAKRRAIEKLGAPLKKSKK